MSSFYAGLITLAVLVVAVFFILVMVELRHAIRALEAFLKTVELTVNPTLEELRKNLQSTRTMTENISILTEDVKVFSGSLREMGENANRVSRTVRSIASLMDEQTFAATMKVSAVKAGVRAASEILLTNFLSKRKA
jgi:uncharacterized protein YoxC